MTAKKTPPVADPAVAETITSVARELGTITAKLLLAAYHRARVATRADALRAVADAATVHAARHDRATSDLARARAFQLLERASELADIERARLAEVVATVP